MKPEKEWTILTAVTLRDLVPSKVDAIFIHAQSDLELELLACAADTYRNLQPRQPHIVLNGLKQYEPTPNSWGCNEWRKMLSGPLAVSSENILLTSPARHTGEEAERSISLCHEFGWKNLVIMATPYRLPRCFLSQLGVASSRGFGGINLHCLTISMAWNRRISKHSVIHGSNIGNGFDQLDAEFDKILAYRADYLTGDSKFSPIASIQEGVEYLRLRP